LSHFNGRIQPGEIDKPTKFINICNDIFIGEDTA